jgi:hypothetical protein
VAQASHVLLAMGQPAQSARGSLRLSLGHTRTTDDVDAAQILLERAEDRDMTLTPDEVAYLDGLFVAPSGDDVSPSQRLARFDAALESGAARINLGTAALENPEWAADVIGRYGEAVAVGLDVRGTTLAARGWTREGGDLWAVLDRLEDAGCSRYVVTDVTKDGTLRGPNVELLREVATRTPKPVVASGGISSLDDIAALRELVPLGVEGAIVGKALYAGAFTLAEALDVAGR